MDDGGGTIGGGSVYVKFHLGHEDNKISEVELKDEAKTANLTFVFPDGVDFRKEDHKLVITVASDKLRSNPVKIKWDHAAGQTLGATA